MRVRVVLAGLLLVGAAACTSGPKAPAATGTAAPKQALPAVTATPTPSGVVESPALDEQTTAVFVRTLRLEDPGHTFDKLSDAQLASAADGACGGLRAGRPVGEVKQGLIAQGFSTPQALTFLTGAVMMGSDSLCPDQRQKYQDWRAAGAS